MSQGAIYIGTSGWYYEHWIKNFYPEDSKPTDRLYYYAKHFNTVEINTSFYHLPKIETVKKWDTQVSNKFIFSVKASRYITHMKRLKDAEESTKLFYSRIKYLEPHLGPILFQLPPSFKKNTERLVEFISHLSNKYDHVFEFRHPSWYCEEIYEILKKEKLGLCITDLGGELSPLIVTSHFAYLRLHGPKIKYQGTYGTKKIQEWKKQILEFSKNKITTYCYFDNDEKGYAVQDALKLQSLIKE
jgi:uncharacterized protein YecE (DUF72 family)